MGRRVLFNFDALALYEALDEQRRGRELSWVGVAQEMWDLSADLNSRRHDHPISPSTVRNLATRGATSCQHALFMLRWLGRPPESFLVGVTPHAGDALPQAGADRRLRWNLVKLHAALELARRQRGLTWVETAREIKCHANQLQGLRTVKFAVDMNLAMKCVQWLGVSASEFIYAADW